MANKIRGEQIKDGSITGDDVDESTLVLDTLRDADNDTKIQIEESADEDKIRFDTAGTERLVINADGGMAFGNGSTAGVAGSWNFFNFKGGGVRVVANNFYCDNDRGVLWGDSSVSVKANATAGSESLTVRANYNAFIHVDGVNNAVGIGTVSPGALLHVSSSDDGAILQVDTTDGTSVLFVTGSGRVGIGTSTPAVQLHVTSSHDATAAILAEGNGVTIKSGSHSSYGSSLKFINTGYSHATMGVSGSAFVIAETSAGTDQWSGVTPLLTVGLGADATGGGSGPTQGYVGIGTVSPGALLHVEGDAILAGSQKVKVRDVSATSSITVSDYCIRCVQTSAITLTLPSKTSNLGQVLIFKDALGNATSNSITIAGAGSDTIDGDATYVLDRDLEGVTFICDGINGWMKISRIR